MQTLSIWTIGNNVIWERVNEPEVLAGSVLQCVTQSLEAPGSSHTGSSGFIMGVSLGLTLQRPSLVLGNPWKSMEM